MFLEKWDDIPIDIRNEKVKPYYDLLNEKKVSLSIKRIFDIVVSLILLLLLSPIFLIISSLIKIDSRGPVFFRQVRITKYGRKFQILKFRTMVNHADKIGTQVTIFNDKRITKVGAKLRDWRLDEIPQLVNILQGDMSFVGTRPEVEKYVKFYSDEMMATLLLPAGVTSEASIQYKDEAKYLNDAENIDEAYVKKVLPEKMKFNLRSIQKFTFINDILTIVKTIVAVIK
ncbi:sugar transferase [Rummeliibacillus sp. NPDC094406]|uniref:sugar transferase n=1 Tax=Rummeliibacillus sp. NPDC094406 TaxID=3364511 RepID=UPI003830B153